MNQIEAYAIALVGSGAESHAEDDIDEDAEFENEADARAAADLAVQMAIRIKQNPKAFLGWYRYMGEERAHELGG